MCLDKIADLQCGGGEGTRFMGRQIDAPYQLLYIIGYGQDHDALI